MNLLQNFPVSHSTSGDRLTASQLAVDILLSILINRFWVDFRLFTVIFLIVQHPEVIRVLISQTEIWSDFTLEQVIIYFLGLQLLKVVLKQTYFMSMHPLH